MNSTIQLIIEFIMKILGLKGPGQEPNKPTPTPAKPEVKPAPSPPVEEKPLAPVIPITPAIMQTTLMLGHYDEGLDTAKMKEILALYHQNMGEKVSKANKENKMRNGDLFEWVDLKKLAGNAVQTLQSFLVNAGIMHPTSNCDGNFAYATQAGVRMFQEYNRVYENQAIIPNGIVDEATWALMKKWQDQKKTAESWARGKQSDEYKKWLSMIKKSQNHYLANPHLITQKVNERIEQMKKNPKFPGIDTIPVGAWTFNAKNEDEIHLIGIRRKEDTGGIGRKNDDVFILLINGMVFKFWGSTDPKQGKKNRKDEPFLAEGQHKFRFGWHNRGAQTQKTIYQGLNPYKNGVLVFRDDSSNDNKLTVADISKGIDKDPNYSINIHWTGVGNGRSGTWSAGCQVIAGSSYIDPMGVKQDCSKFAAGGTANLKANKEDKISVTKGAYNIFSDLVLLFPQKRVDYLIYTLGRDDTVGEDFLAGTHGDELLASTLKAFDLEQGGENFA